MYMVLVVVRRWYYSVVTSCEGSPDSALQRADETKRDRPVRAFPSFFSSSQTCLPKRPRQFLGRLSKRQRRGDRRTVIPPSIKHSHNEAKLLTFSFRTVDSVDEIAKKKGISMAQVAVAWVLSKEGVSAPIVGTTSLKNLEDLLGMSTTILFSCAKYVRVGNLLNHGLAFLARQVRWM